MSLKSNDLKEEMSDSKGMNLIIQYFTSDNVQRRAEYLQSLYENLKGGLFDKVYVFVADDTKIDILSDRLEVIQCGKRPTFLDLMTFCNESLKGELCVIANGDIIFDSTINILLKSKLDNVFIALTRWELEPKGKGLERIPLPLATSQDTWIFRSPIKTREDMNIPIGQTGCDNRMARIVYELGYEVKNPCKQIITTHLHQAQYVQVTDKVPGPYLCLMPSDNIRKRTDYILVDHL